MDKHVDAGSCGGEGGHVAAVHHLAEDLLEARNEPATHMDKLLLAGVL